MRTPNLLLWSCLVLAACGGAPGAPTIKHFTASPGSLPVGGGEVTIDWEVVDASSSSVAPGVGTLSPAGKGTVQVTVTANTTFVLTATNSAGPTSEQVSVTVASAPSLSISPTTRAFVAGNPGGTFDANVQGSSGAIRWSLVGAGSIAPSTGPTVVYTPPLTVAGPATATLTASVDGTALSATASVNIAPATLTGGLLFYRRDGSAEVKTVNGAGELSAVKQFSAGELPAGATHFGKPYDLYELFYDSATGAGALGSFNGAGAFHALRTYAPGELPAGKTHLVSLGDRLVLYAAGTITCGTYGGTNYDYALQKTVTGIGPSWEVVLPVTAGVLFYRTGGTLLFGAFDSSCQWAPVSAYSGFTVDWTTIVNTRSGAFFYRRTDGLSALVTFAANGTAVQVGTYLAGTVRKEWDQIVDTRFGVLFYARDGSGELGTLTGNTYAKLKTWAAGELPLGADLVASVGN